MGKAAWGKWDFVEERIEKLLPGEKKARNKTLFFDLAMDDATLTLDKVIWELEEPVLLRRRDLMA
jgi:hypothetical protein